jgi:hypothetical protein
MKSTITKVSSHYHNEAHFRALANRTYWLWPLPFDEESNIDEIIPPQFQREDDLAGVPE